MCGEDFYRKVLARVNAKAKAKRVEGEDRVALRPQTSLEERNARPSQLAHDPSTWYGALPARARARDKRAGRSFFFASSTL